MKYTVLVVVTRTCPTTGRFSHSPLPQCKLKSHKIVTSSCKYVLYTVTEQIIYSDLKRAFLPTCHKKQNLFYRVVCNCNLRVSSFFISYPIPSFKIENSSSNLTSFFYLNAIKCSSCHWRNILHLHVAVELSTCVFLFFALIKQNKDVY